MAKKSVVKNILLDYKVWGIAGLIVGFVITYFLFGGKPSVQTTTNSSLSKTTTNADFDKNSKTTVKVKGAERIDTKPDGSASYYGPNLDFESVNEEVGRLKLQVSSLEKELSQMKIINYTAGIGPVVNPFKLSQVGVIGEVKIVGSLWVGNISSVNFQNWEFNTQIFIMYHF